MRQWPPSSRGARHTPPCRCEESKSRLDQMLLLEREVSYHASFALLWTSLHRLSPAPRPPRHPATLPPCHPGQQHQAGGSDCSLCWAMQERPCCPQREQCAAACESSRHLPAVVKESAADTAHTVGPCTGVFITALFGFLTWRN
ncbi:hypothetical protein E2C01_001114 [Portunus trituberculatus]|uniref:Uncharacterized protein n=1 Tax=Portunus trituberculatus TaxID=210409 RepID=A0A5B7CGD8_PORTR|nr:hypothetical protein [Portunus trituberculatus]